jgi:phosphocarrier protein
MAFESAPYYLKQIFMPLSQDAMNREIFRRKVTVQDPLGFHMRPVAAFAQCAGQYESTINVQKDDLRVNGKSILELLLLAAEQGTELVLEADGADAPAALEALAELIELSKDDDEPPDSSLPRKG